VTMASAIAVAVSLPRLPAGPVAPSRRMRILGATIAGDKGYGAVDKEPAGKS
jgi:hypothetical protein